MAYIFDQTSTNNAFEYLLITHIEIDDQVNLDITSTPHFRELVTDNGNELFLFLGAKNMNTSCPVCKSTKVQRLHTARSIGTTIGAVGGAASGAGGALSGAQTGAAVGVVGGPVGMFLGGLAGAILGGMIGGAAGSMAGAKIGDVVDEQVLGNFQCGHCGHVFTDR